MITSVCSSSYTFDAGSSARTMRQKTQSSVAWVSVMRVILLDGFLR